MKSGRKVKGVLIEFARVERKVTRAGHVINAFFFGRTEIHS